MFFTHTIRRLTATVLLCAASVASAQGFDAPTPVDGIYRDLGRGDLALALRDSARLLQKLAPNAPGYGEALQARLDLLGQQDKLDAPAAANLRDKMTAFVSLHPDRRGLLDRLDLAQAWANRDAATVAAIANRIETVSVQVPASEQAESRTAAALALAGATGRLDDARNLAEPALEFWRHHTGIKANWCVVQLASLLALAEQNSGDEIRAMDLLDDASQRAIRAFGVDSTARMRIDNLRAGLLSAFGRSREVLQLRESVLEVIRRRYGDVSFETGNAEAMLGAALQEIGDYAAARTHYAKALATFAQVPSTPARERGILHANYGNLLQEMGAEDDALASYHRALDLFGDGPKSAHARAVIISNIGNTEFRLQHYAAAKADFLKALALRERADGPDSPGLAYALEGLGSACLALHDYAEAERIYRRALKLRGLKLADNHPTLGPLRFGLALARWGQRDERAAFALAVETARHQQEIMATFASDFAERQSMAFREMQTSATALAVTLAARLGDAASIATAWQLSMAERGLVARAQTQRLAAARARRDPATAAALERWRRINRLLGDAWLAAASDPARIANLHQQAEAAERELWPHGTRLGGITDEAPTVADLARALPDDGLLITYSEGVASDPARLLTAGRKPRPEDWYAFEIDPRGSLRLVRVGNVQALSAQIRAWYLDLRTPTSDPERLRADGLAVRRAVFDPVVAGRRPQHLFVIPAGELYRINFAALPDRKGYLIESLSGVQTLTQESELLLEPVHVAHPLVLLAGAPTFAQTSLPIPAAHTSCRAAPVSFAPIPNAARELDVLHDVLDNAAIEARVTMLSGAAATKTAVVNALTHVNVVHLATHGFSLDEDCADTAGARGVTLVVANEPMDASSETVLSGLALSAAHRGGGAAADVLGAGELATLDLSGVDWIVLSACDSGLGTVGRNEGVFGMRRALRVAGARTVVMSLWPVDDASTVDLMQSLYRARFVERRDVPGAMGAAMRAELARRRRAGLSDHPFYWAAFVSEGGWR
jgi:CHAT domain-containing protein/tetratricopeptide (TPR) repeat protein